MSQRVARKKRVKSTQSVSNQPQREDSDIAGYFKDSLTLAPDENRLTKVSEIEIEKIKNKTSRSAGIKSKADQAISLIPAKKLKGGLTENQNNFDVNSSKNRSHDASKSLLSVPKSQKSFTSFKNKSDVFNNITESFSSSKILSAQVLNEIDSQKRLELSTWGLPPLILEKYEARGIKSMFPWQVECLAKKNILEENKNLVYSAPTSAGKTLVAEFLMLKTVLERRKKAIFILPFVSVVREKMFYFQDLLSDSGVRVEGFMGGVAPPGGFSAVHIAIATIEKANSLINRLMEDGDLVTLGAVIIDELHLLGDPSRGYLLELLLTKLRYMTLRLEHIDIQLIGMSATLPNLPLIAEWLDAELYKTDFRPIPLRQQCKIGSSLLDTKFNAIRELEAAPDIVGDTDHIIQLCIETINGGHGVLIFCPTKNWCEKLAIQLASAFFQLGRDNTPHGKILRNHIDSTAVQEVLAQLEHCPIGLDNVLKKTVSFGVAFHHAGLTMDERDIIEGGFRVGSLKVLVATSTLSSGVNLPARRVIIRSPMFNGKLIDKLTYQQMTGRAGRMGKDTEGESILICKGNERTAAIKLMAASLEPIVSCLEGSGPLIRALLEAIASQVVRTPKDLDFYSKCTFVYKCEENGVKELVDEAVQFLISNEFLLVKDNGEQEQRMVATCLGKACLAASIPPREGLFLFEELQRARKCFVLDTELHVVYLVTPFNSGSQINQIDWMIFMELWRKLSESERRVGQLVGVEERFLMTAMRGVVKPGKTLNIHRRFYTALALHDLVREVPLSVVCSKYNCCRGLLQSLQQSSATFAGMVTHFCKELKWDCMELLFHQFQARLQFGVCRDLLDLLRLPSLNGLRARSLFKHRITTVAELAAANEFDVEEALNKALPFESEKDFDGENEAEIAKRTKMRTVFITGKDGMTAREAAIVVIKEARELVKNELGIRDVQWSQNSKNPSRSNVLSLINTSVSPKPVSPHSHLKTPISSIGFPTSLEPVNIPKDKQPSPNVSAGMRTDNTIKEKKLDNELIVQKQKDHFVQEKELHNEKHQPKNDEISIVVPKDTAIDSGKSQGTSRTLRSKVSENSKTMTKEDQFTICSLDFQDSPEYQRKSVVKKKVIPEESISSTSKNVEKISNNKIDEEPMEIDEIPNNNEANKVNINEEQISDFSRSLSLSPGDVINESDKPEAASRTLRSKLAEKTKSFVKDDRFTVCSLDFEGSPDFQEKVAQENKVDSQKVCKSLQNKDNSPVPESFLVSERALDEIMQIADKEKEQEQKKDQEKEQEKDIFTMPAPVIDNKVEEDKKRASGGSNYSRSPSMFSDSSFMDAQLCSVLEKNVIEGSCLADFEKSNFTQPKKLSEKDSISIQTTRNSDLVNNPNNTDNSKTLVNVENVTNPDASKQISPRKNESKIDEAKQTTMPSTWVEDSWDQSKNVQPNKKKDEDAETQSPSLLTNTRVRGRARPLLPSQLVISKIQSTTRKKNAPESPLIGTPKPIIPKRVFDQDDVKKSPIKSIRTYNTRRPIVPIASSSNKSDSEDSIVSSQTVSTRATTSKMRTKIEQKILMTQKSVRTVKITAAPKLLKQNSQPLFEDSSSSDDDVKSTESGLMFDSDDTVKSTQSTRSKTSKASTSSVTSLKLLRADSCTTEERINPKKIEPVNVANSKRSFKLFRSEMEASTPDAWRKDLALAIVTEPCARDPALTIGNKIIGGVDDKKKKEKKADAYVYENKKVCGIVVSWGLKSVYYMPFSNTQDTKISIKERMSFLRDLLTNPLISLRCFNVKEVYKMFYVCCKIEPRCQFLDPKAGDWLMNTETSCKTYSELAAQYFPRGLDITNAMEIKFGENVLTGIMRTAAKALFAWYLTDAILGTLKEHSPILLSAFKDVEMPTILILANIELRGFGINLPALQELSIVIKNDLSSIEENAFNLAGRKFNFYSSKDVAQVLGLNRKGRGCTNKNALKSCENPISNLITLWRKLSTVQTKIIYPLLQLEKKDNRIHGNCITYTVTGRVSMHEPNLQTIPRDFKSDISGCVLSVRMAFIPIVGNIMLSADFCQLELRILAHFCEDPILHKLMHEQGDIFRNIAARLNKISEDKVDDDMRQRAKQLCYAMIYGMGTKSLAETLSVTESEAKDYLEAFMNTYKGIRIWLNACYEQARIEGFVSTITDRRRMLPGIHSKIPAVKSQAERQAVNTKVQGSAADIAKKAMVLIETKLRKEFSYLPLTFPTTQARRKLRSSDADSRPRGAYLILQLHDELLYEVNCNDLKQVAYIVKHSMENAFKLRVPLPVKVKVGSAWGNLEEYQV